MCYLISSLKNLTLKESFVGYLKRNPQWLVIDVGAHIGRSTKVRNELRRKKINKFLN